MLQSCIVENDVKAHARAASRVLVPMVQASLFCLLLPVTAGAQMTAPATAPSVDLKPRFAILDNSFLVEEALNQEAGVFQNIFGFQRNGAAWDLAFTQEWPVKSQRHQFSYTLPFAGLSADRGFGDVMVHYRYQAMTEDLDPVAFSPRWSLILPTGSGAFTSRALGLQVNLPVSRQQGSFYFHANGGVTWFPRAEPAAAAGHMSLLTPHVSGSAIYGLRPMFNLMLESVLEFEQSLTANGTRNRERAFTLSPGARGGWNLGDKQLILGAAVPITWTASEASAGILVYLSYELPFRK